jgi:hypothetical protein
VKQRQAAQISNIPGYLLLRQAGTVPQVDQVKCTSLRITQINTLSEQTHIHMIRWPAHPTPNSVQNR